MSTGERIKTLRKDKGMTQKHLAELTGIAIITIQQYEAGKYEPKVPQLRRIAAALGVGLDAFIDLDGDNNLARSAQDTRDKLLEGVPKTCQEAEDWKENVLVECFRKLNTKGKKKAVETIEDLTYIEKYTVPDKDT